MDRISLRNPVNPANPEILSPFSRPCQPTGQACFHPGNDDAHHGDVGVHIGNVVVLTGGVGVHSGDGGVVIGLGDADGAGVGVLTGLEVVLAADGGVRPADVGVHPGEVGDLSGSRGVRTGGAGALFERNGVPKVTLRETVPIPRAQLWGGLNQPRNSRQPTMARKSVTVKQPKNIDDSVLAVERMLLRNDGVLPVVPQSTIFVTLGALVGLNVTPPSQPTPPAPVNVPPGTHKIPEEIAGPLRTLYPSMKRNYLDYVAVKQLFGTATNNLQQQLGFADGQTLATTGTVRNLVNRAIKSLLGVFAGNENELETYGLAVTVDSGTTTPPPPPATGP